MMSGVNYVICGCSSARTTAEVSLYQNFLNTEEKYCSYYSKQGDRWQFEKTN